MTGDPEKTAKAHHIAGHAVMASILGFPIQRVFFDGDDAGLGYERPDDIGDIPVRDWLLVTLAGNQAELRLLRGRDEVAYETAARLAFDMIDVLRTFERLGVKSTGVSGRLRGKLGKMLAVLFEDEDVWAAVQTVARALETRRELDAEALSRLIPPGLKSAASRCAGLACDM